MRAPWKRPSLMNFQRGALTWRARIAGPGREAPARRGYTARMTDLPPLILDISRSIRDEGGQAFLVGGWVRDLEMLRLQGVAGMPAADELDLEVYGLPVERLVSALGRHGEVKLV